MIGNVSVDRHVPPTNRPSAPTTAQDFKRTNSSGMNGPRRTNSLLKPGVIAAIGVAAVIVIAAVVLGLVCCIRRKRKHNGLVDENTH